MSNARPIGVLFVCLGNICRSPLAEGIFRHLVREAGLEDRFTIDSAGTSSYHIGDPPDSRTAEVARRRGVDLTSRGRQLAPADLTRFDWVLAMDGSNLEKVERMAARAHGTARVRLLRAFDPEAAGELEVPDPYYGGPEGFENVHDMVERACRGLLARIREEEGI